ncbi:MAG: hypothetical protein LBB21_07225 [Holosporaceae bacterium]|jgi:hypothetical protein|nr:hypothetical protein [Holosporaceae bacterium]
MLTGFVCGLVVLNSMAAIEGRDIIFTSEIMKKDDKMPTTFANALAILKSDWLLKLRNYGNITYAENRTDERSRVDARNIGKAPVTSLLAKLFPCNGGVLEVSTGSLTLEILRYCSAFAQINWRETKISLTCFLHQHKNWFSTPLQQVSNSLSLLKHTSIYSLYTIFFDLAA